MCEKLPRECIVGGEGGRSKGSTFNPGEVLGGCMELCSVC